jgi:hypothetical protein
MLAQFELAQPEMCHKKNDIHCVQSNEESLHLPCTYRVGSVKEGFIGVAMLEKAIVSPYGVLLRITSLLIQLK